MHSSIPTSKLARGTVLGKAIFKIGATTTKGVVKRAFMSKDKKRLQNLILMKRLQR